MDHSPEQFLGTKASELQTCTQSITQQELDALLRPLHPWYWEKRPQYVGVYPSFRAYYSITTRYKVFFEIGTSVIVLEAFRRRSEKSLWRGWITLIPMPWNRLINDAQAFETLKEVKVVPLAIQQAAANVILTLLPH